MQLITDLHVHSHFSRATSKRMDLQGMYYWGKLKGINVIGTGDFTHPGWMAELQEKLEPAEPGLFKLKEKYARIEDKQLPSSVKKNLLRFILTVEISNIYKKGDKVRKLHNVVIVPDLKTASKLNGQLSQIGNLQADGRPILGMDSKLLLEMTLNSHADSYFIPAHIWTPWFSMFGSKSGFDSVAEAFDELAPEITAIETGLSSDPAMNYRIADLDGRTLVSHSDAHSPEKLGREANVINASLTYQDIIGAIKTGDKRFVGTIEFFPQEGKYHLDGHRKCNFVCSPEKSKKLNNLCPKCGQPLVLGVDHRVTELASRPENYQPKNPKQVEYIIPLSEIIAEIKGVKGTKSKAVVSEYGQIISLLGDEFSLLRTVPISEIKAAGKLKLAEAIERLRKKQVVLKGGYDGVYGVVKVFKAQDKSYRQGNQLPLV